MTDGLRKSHLRKAPQVGLSEVGLPEGNLSVEPIISHTKMTKGDFASNLLAGLTFYCQTLGH